MLFLTSIPRTLLSRILCSICLWCPSSFKFVSEPRFASESVLLFFSFVSSQRMWQTQFYWLCPFNIYSALMGLFLLRKTRVMIALSHFLSPHLLLNRKTAETQLHPNYLHLVKMMQRYFTRTSVEGMGIRILQHPCRGNILLISR